MVETFQTTKLEDRPSQKLGFGNYVKQTLFWATLPITAGLATLTFGLLTKNKVFPLDGSPTILQHLWEKVFSKAIHSTTGAHLKIEETERMWFLTRFMAPEKRLPFTHGAWNFLKGTEIAVIPTAFHFWRQHERQRAELLPLHDRLEKLGDLKPTDADLAAENRSLQRQLEYMKGEASPTLASEGRSHQGTLAAAPGQHLG